MIQLSDFQHELQTIVDGIGHTLNLESAIFDTRSTLIASTSTYLQEKGQSVHAPSIEEVLHNGKILVNKPGFMKSCIGCRFKDNCPSTIEIMSSVKVDSRPVGVITLTSFTTAGHNRITEHIDLYSNMLNVVTELVGNVVGYKHKSHTVAHIETLFHAALNASDDGILAVDGNGAITHANASAHKLFSFCGLYTRTLKQVLPDYLGTRIMAGQSLSHEMIRINNSDNLLSSTPLALEGPFDGAILRFSPTAPTRSKSSKPAKTPAFSLDALKGTSPQMAFLKERIVKVASSTSTVLITGETGTGKGLAAKALHYESKRRSFPFVSINCASIPENLFESELFGYEEGAFTGARKGGKPGQFELAQHGTLFLDEIGELPLHVQSKLLKVLQDHTLERVGGVNSIPIDVRIIAATNKNLEEMIAEKKFRDDLYYRLNVIPLTMAPLRERQNDLWELAKTFLNQYSLRLGKKINGFSEDVQETLRRHPWPGNIRELENVIEYAVNMEDSSTITLRSLPEKYWHAISAEHALSNSNQSTTSTAHSCDQSLLQQTLNRHGWDMRGKEKAAEELGIGLRTLYRRLKQEGL